MVEIQTLTLTLESDSKSFLDYECFDTVQTTCWTSFMTLDVDCTPTKCWLGQLLVFWSLSSGNTKGTPISLFPSRIARCLRIPWYISAPMIPSIFSMMHRERLKWWPKTWLIIPPTSSFALARLIWIFRPFFALTLFCLIQTVWLLTRQSIILDTVGRESNEQNLSRMQAAFLYWLLVITAF